MQQQRNPTTASQLLAQTRDLLNKVKSLSDAKEFYDSESGSSSGAAHVPDQTSTILTPRALPRCDSGLPRDTQNCIGIMGNVFERPPVQEGLSWTIFQNSKNLASSSKELGPDTTDTARKRENGNEKRIVDYADSITSLPKQKWNVKPYWWNLISHWYG